MSIVFKEFGTVRFIEPPSVPLRSLGDIGCNEYISNDFCQPVLQTDETKFQLDLTQIDGVELVTNGSFTGSAAGWTLDAGWTYGSNKVSIDLASTTSGISQDIGIEEGCFYQVIFTILDYVNGEINVIIGGTTIATITAGNGTYTVYGIAGSVNNDIELAANGPLIPINLSLDNVSVIAYSAPGLVIYNCTDSTVDYTSYDGSDFLTDENSTSVIGCIDWNGTPPTLSNGKCYTICIADICDNTYVSDGTFDTACGGGSWTCGVQWTIAAGGSRYLGPGIPTAESARTLTNTLTSTIAGGGFVLISFEITAYVAITTMEVRLTDGTNTVIVVTGINSTGVKRNVVDLTGFADTVLFDELLFVGAETVGTIQMDNVMAVDLICSEKYCLEATYPCTLLFEWSNLQGTAQNAFGFDYTNFSWQQKMRMFAGVGSPQYPLRIDKMKINTNGGSKVQRAMINRDYIISMRKAPQYIHEALRIGLKHDVFTITGSNTSGTFFQDKQFYQGEGAEYEIQWSDQDKEKHNPALAPARATITENALNLSNQACSS